MKSRNLLALVMIFSLVLTPMTVNAKNAKVFGVIKSNSKDTVLAENVLKTSIENTEVNIITSDDIEITNTNEDLEASEVLKKSEDTEENKDAEPSVSTVKSEDTSKFKYMEDGTPVLDGRLGDCGRLMIPWGNYSSAIFSTDWGLKESFQDVTDNADSSIFLTIYNDGTPIIGDHSNQGLSCLYNAVEDESKLYIYTSDSNVETYLCTDRFHGHNINYLVDLNGNDISYADTDLIVYTCDPDTPGVKSGYNVTITYWKNISRKL